MSYIYSNFTFSKKQVAEFLRCAPATVTNREKAGKYPTPKKALYGRSNKVYYLPDIFYLMYLTDKKIHLGPVTDYLNYRTGGNKEGVDAMIKASFKAFEMMLASDHTGGKY